MQFNIVIRASTGEIVKKYTVSNYWLAVEQFKQLIGERGAGLQLHLLHGTSELFRYDLRPETNDLYRWQAKTEYLTDRSILPNWVVARELIALHPEITLQRIYGWKNKFVDGYNRIISGGVYTYDMLAIEQILKREHDII